MVTTDTETIHDPGTLDEQERIATLNLYQKIAAITRELGAVEKTGKSQYKEAWSIEDVEEALTPLLTKYRVVTRFSYEAIDAAADGKLWLSRVSVTLVNVDDPDDHFTDTWADVGNTPMASQSFLAKGFYKRLFHIRDDDEGDESRGEEHRGSPNQFSSRSRETTRAVDPPRASPYKPASANQLATIAKLSRLLGEPEGMPENATSADASERITVLSREYNERKGPSGAKRTNGTPEAATVAAPTPATRTPYPTERPALIASILEMAGDRVQDELAEDAMEVLLQGCAEQGIKITIGERDTEKSILAKINTPGLEAMHQWLTSG